MDLSEHEKREEEFHKSLDKRFDAIEKKLDEQKKESELAHDNILIEVKNINGRVRDLQEDKIRRDEQYRMLKWGLAIVTSVLTAMVTLWLKGKLML